jgi:Na+-driven multidrug efflux pump
MFIWLFLALNGLLWLFYAVLTGYQQTKFLMVVNIASMWLIAILPIYLITKYAMLNVQYIWPLINLYVLVASIAVIVRYRQIYTQSIS